MLSGDSMPNRPPTQTLRLVLESLFMCNNLGAKSLQLVPNGLNVGSALDATYCTYYILSSKPSVPGVLCCIP